MSVLKQLIFRSKNNFISERKQQTCVPGYTLLNHVPPTSVFFSNNVTEVAAPNFFCNCMAAQMPETLLIEI